MTEFCPAPFCCACTTRSHIREEARAYGPFCHKEQVHDLLRQKISKQIERYSIYSAYCAAFVKVKYTDVEKEDTEKQKLWKISKEQKKFLKLCRFFFFSPHGKVGICIHVSCIAPFLVSPHRIKLRTLLSRHRASPILVNTFSARNAAHTPRLPKHPGGIPLPIFLQAPMMLWPCWSLSTFEALKNRRDKENFPLSTSVNPIAVGGRATKRWVQ